MIKFFKKLFCRHNPVKYHGVKMKPVTFVKYMNEGPPERMTKNFPINIYSCAHCGKFLEWHQVPDAKENKHRILGE